MPYFCWKQHDIFYRARGEGPLLLILPGHTTSSICYEAELEYFSRRFCVVSPDFLGTGRSDRLNFWTRSWWKNAAEQAVALIEHLDRPDCVVLGASGGAIIAFLMALDYPEKVRAIIADSFVDRITKNQVLNHIVRERGRRTDRQQQFWENAHGPDWQDVVEADTALLLRFTERSGDWLEGRLGEIQCPVLVTGSKRDAVFPDITRKLSRMSEEITDCSMYIGNNGGHPLMWKSPRDFRTVVDCFLDRTIFESKSTV